ncbi:hypothetical protein [Litorihabitans aurantiacus]|uniref:Methionine synthase n=1 Tax=Litorihabitans aurantiacus TaxID=1930061 RepID=A0AA37XDR5_9MICO|nr:hypothetical protein [Litorihabitans aurantiacus]GMA30737.1 hypothetical protein GCM10025875_07290 [Litorihabitans aurantiacus]
MTLTISGLGAWPGRDEHDAFAAHQAILEVLAAAPSGVDGLPHLAVLPARGPWAAPIGRTLALLEAMPAALEPHGWRLAGAPSAELVRAERVLAADVESFALAAAGYDGPLAAPVLGPFSLAASVWLGVGERVVDDAGATADVVESLGVGLGRHLEAVAFAVSGSRAAAGALAGADAVPDPRDSGDSGPAAVSPEALSDTVLVHEPLLADVVSGRIATFTGSGRLRPPESSWVSAQLGRLVQACAPHPCVLVVPPDAAAIAVASAAAPHALATDVTALDPAGWEALAEAVESGRRVWAASVPHRRSDARPDPGAAARAVLTPWRAIGLPTADLSFTLAPRPGLGMLTPSAAADTLRDTARTALALAELVA